MRNASSLRPFNPLSTAVSGAFAVALTDGRTKDELNLPQSESLQTPSLTAMPWRPAFVIRSPKHRRSLCPAAPTSEVARSLSDHTSIFSISTPFSSLFSKPTPRCPRLILIPLFYDPHHEPSESKYNSRVILTFVLRIPKVKLGAGRHASEPVQWPPRAANTHSYPSASRRARPRLRLPPPALGTRKPTRARRRGGMVAYLLREGGFRRGIYFCIIEAIRPRPSP